MNRNEPVAVARCAAYDPGKIYGELARLAPAIGLTREAIAGKRVVVKPNLLLAFPPERAATTHPAVTEAVLRLLLSFEPASLLIAESPGGIYNERSLAHVYSVTGMKAVSEATGVPLNTDVSYGRFSLTDGVTAKNIDVITPVAEAEVLVNVCKMKTHALAVMTGASKNLFGVVPGINKFEMHARFKMPADFFSMVAELDEALERKLTLFHISDGIVGMEGDGPSGGTPKAAGVLLMSRNPFNLDLVAAEIMGLSGRVRLLQIAADRGDCPASVSEVPLIGPTPAELGVTPFTLPDAAKGRKFDRIPPFLQPHPVVDRKICRGCGRCAESCPQKTIAMKGKFARIDPSRCIRCYCCQELCPFQAIRIRKNLIYKLVE